MSSYADLDSLDLLDESSPLVATQQQVSSEPAAESRYPRVNEIHALRNAISDVTRQDPTRSPLALGQRGDETSPLTQKEIALLPSVSISTPTPTPENSSVFTLASGTASRSSGEAPSSSNSPEERVARASIPVLKKKDPHANGYNLNLILLKELYAPADQRSHNQALAHIQKGKGYYKQLDDLTRLTRIFRTLNKDHPPQIDVTNNAEAKALLEKAADLGLVERGKSVFSDKEMEILLANLETECKILPNRAQVEFSMVGPLRDQALQTTKIVQKGMELDQELIRRIHERMGR